MREIFSYISWILTELGYGIKPQSHRAHRGRRPQGDFLISVRIEKKEDESLFK